MLIGHYDPPLHLSNAIKQAAKMLAPKSDKTNVKPNSNSNDTLNS
jgi:hypothetical protein